MRAFVTEPLVWSVIVAVIGMSIVYLVAKYTYFFDKEVDQSGDSELVKMSRNHWGRLREKWTVVVMIILIANMIFIVNILDSRKTLTRIKKEHILPVKATAKKERKSPYGIRIYLQDDVHSSYQFDLDNPELTNEFIEKVNSGYLVSKFRNSTDLLLTNGCDSVYYNLYY